MAYFIKLLNQYVILIVCGIKCMYAETFGCMYAEFGCMSIKRLGACMRKRLGAKYAAVGCKFHNG